MIQKMKEYIKRIFPDAVFTDEDGNVLMQYAGKYGAEVQFYKNEAGREQEHIYSCYLKSGNYVITDDF